MCADWALKDRQKSSSNDGCSMDINGASQEKGGNDFYEYVQDWQTRALGRDLWRNLGETLA